MKKYKLNLEVTDNTPQGSDAALLKLTTTEGVLPECLPGQFVNILVPDTPGAFLRRPISICNVEENSLWLYVKNVGKGSNTLCHITPGKHLDIVLPLGHGFTTSLPDGAKPLLIGGGVGVAPLLYLGKALANKGIKPHFLLGAATESALNLLDEFIKYGELHITTDDGSRGTKGNVLAHEIMNDSDFAPTHIYCCGPTPMMKGVAAWAKQRGIKCEVSLENHMACGIGACLCCVEKTKDGHKCVCTVGPVFNIETLDW